MGLGHAESLFRRCQYLQNSAPGCCASETEEDIHTVMEYAVKVAVPLTPRAAGTNLTGSAIGAGIIVDISRLNRLLEVNRDEQWARVQPGLVLSEFNKRLAPMGLMCDTSFTEHIDVERMGKPCATCAKCNSVCPVYDVFQSENMSARGWFEIVTASDYSYLQSERVVEACLNCKSCRTICPAGVDVSELILQRRAEHLNELAGWVFALHTRQWIFHPLLKLMA